MTMKNKRNPIEKYFKLFPYLHDDIKLNILGYCADAPMENFPYLSSTLISYRSVNLNFQKLCDSDVLWKGALKRICSKEPIFLTALRQYVQEQLEPDQGLGSTDTSIEDLLQAAQPQQPSFKSLYETLVNQYLRVHNCPVFGMPGVVAMGQPYSIHMFERRYRLMIQLLMANQPESAKQGGPLTSNVTFVHANRAPLQCPLPAVLVRIVQCQMHPDGRADVLLLPLCHVTLEKLSVRANSDHLYMAQALKMGKQLSSQLNQLQRQEALAHVMDGLAAQLAALDSTESEYSSSADGSSNDEHPLVVGA